MKKPAIAICITLSLLGLVACNDTVEPSPIPMQHWKEMNVQIETHPNPPLEGMSEVVVIVTSHGKPVHDLIISLRADDSAPWVQTIQDGYIGLYRRGVSVGFNEKAVLQVRLQRGQEKKILFFPLKLTAG